MEITLNNKRIEEMLFKMGVFKMGEIQAFTSMWINLETIMLSEINQAQEDKHCMITKHRVMMLM